ncbi:hypothetical protein [Roseixanthobacter pseudopolyaromaticivorans]|uniref:hypothetical protein n=1 Tax=Xanthobacteraceae TaxID=335928 RepID=UPI00372898E0
MSPAARATHQTSRRLAMNENAEREAFEKWWGETGSFQSDQDLARQAWKARASLSAPPALGEVVEQASSAHAAAMARIAEAGRRLSYNVDLAQSLATFSDFWGLDCYTPQTSTMNAVRNIVRALLALSQAAPPAPAPAPVVKVRPLEWTRRHEGPAFAGGVTEISRSVFGPYQAWGNGLWSTPGGLSRYAGGCLLVAKEAAQADYEQRVRSALIEPAPVPVPAGVNVVERIGDLEEALRFYADVSKYPAPFTGGMGALWADCGQVARSALGIPDLSKQGEG